MSFEGCGRRQVARLQVLAFRELPVGARLKRLVACVHSAAFMQRYRSDLETRETRRKELAARWYLHVPPTISTDLHTV